jgi:amino acid permease
MIAIGGTIGTGLFVGAGATIAHAGPFGALTGFALVGLLVFLVMNSLGELATHLPVSGSFTTYAGLYVDPSLGFALGNLAILTKRLELLASVVCFISFRIICCRHHNGILGAWSAILDMGRSHLDYLNLRSPVWG